MIILQADDVKKALPMDQTIAAMKSAYAALSSDKAEVPLRAHLRVAPYDGTSLFMPSFVQDEGGDILALKTVSIFPQNIKKDLPIIHAAVLVLEAQTGRVLALLEGGTLTAIRTGAASGAATDLLARVNSTRVAIFGAGVQGSTQLEAVCSIRKIKTALVYDLDADRANSFVTKLAGEKGIPEDLRVAASPREAARQADIICTATTSKTPVYPPEAIQPGTHINGIGSYTLEMRENPPEILQQAAIFVDSIEAVMAEAGEIVTAVNRKLIFPSELTELGNVILGHSPGRKTSEQVTFFKSVGVAVQDAMAARLALQNAVKMGLGQSVDW
jgi:ornithine cyclodeaminase/alanine dehydrogenase-like protein (mu-crystallin family)